MKRNKFSVAFKLAAIRMVESGKSARSVARMLGLGHNSIYDWIAIYHQKGLSGLEPVARTGKRDFSFEEKCRIVRECQGSELSLPELAARHDISSTLLSGWISKARKGGFESLARNHVASQMTVRNEVKHLPKDELEKENERLRKENERLRVEVLLLKKVRALVEERESQNKKIGRGPSKN